jgi:hypothetical protein
VRFQRRRIGIVIGFFVFRVMIFDAARQIALDHQKKYLMRQ